MNARSQEFEFNVELNQVEELICTFLHTLLFHRSTGKFNYQKDGSYTIGTVGYEEVDCHFIDYTYVRCTSEKLHRKVLSSAKQFKDTLKDMDSFKSGQLSLEFCQRRKNPWPFPTESTPWELWVLKINIMSASNEMERASLREKVTDSLRDSIRMICQIVNKPEYIPKMPDQSDLKNVFDDHYSDVQPYLHKINFQTMDYTSDTSVGNTMRKLFKGTFSY